MKNRAFIIGGLLFGFVAQAQYSPQQPWNGKIGETLKESTPYHIEYNKKAQDGAPNIVWVLIDDAGFGATTAFGGLVETPNIEKIANNGLRFTNFHTTAICSPTRAALLTGRNHHSAHVGLLTPAAVDFPGYDTHIPFEKATVAEIFRENGYNTFALGKWHLTPVVENGAAGPFNRWPTGRGFDRFFGFHPGATDQWHPELWEDQTKLDVIEEDTIHVNKLLADKAIKYIANQKSAAPEKPFFLYLATGATHSPHQVAQKWIDKYKGKFDFGWDKYRELVIERQKKQGIIPANVVLPERNPGVKAWNELSEKERKAYAHLMEVYAGFYSYTDYEIGRIVDYLEQIDQLDNTLIVLVLGDNGASKGGGQNGAIAGTGEKLRAADPEANAEAILKANSVTEIFDYPIGWAAAANTPFRYWKADANTEGGTRNPLIISYPKVIKDKGGIRNQYGHVIDVLPTTLELAKGQVPEIINGYKQAPIEGTSLAYASDNAKAPSKHTVQYYEIAGSRAIYKDGWKAGLHHEIAETISIGRGADPSGGKVDFSKDSWELYNLNEDFNERNNLASKNPEKLKELQALFDAEAKKYNVYPIKDFTAHDMPAGRTIYGKQDKITLFPGVDHLVGVNTPLFEGKSFSVTAETEIVSGKEQGVLFAVGGEKNGISLFIKDGKFQYAHKSAGKVNAIVADKQIPKGKVSFRLEYTLTSTRESAAGDIVGTEVIYINNEKVGERSFTKAQAIVIGNSKIDGTDVGRDLIAPVSDQYAVPFAFTGKLKRVTIETLKK